MTKKQQKNIYYYVKLLALLLPFIYIIINWINAFHYQTNIIDFNVLFINSLSGISNIPLYQSWHNAFINFFGNDNFVLVFSYYSFYIVFIHIIEIILNVMLALPHIINNLINKFVGGDF